MKVLASYSIKGGVGKTATAVNLAYLSARAGARTLIWDLDPQGAASFYFRVQLKYRKRTARAIQGKESIASLIRAADYEGLDLIPAGESLRHLDLVLARTEEPRGQLRRLLEPLVGHYDHVYLDCPPGVTLAAEAVFRAADALIVPTVPTVLSLRTLAQLAAFLRKLQRQTNVPSPMLLPFYSMVDSRKQLHRQVVAGEHAVGVPMLQARIPYNSAVERTGLHRSPLPAVAPKHKVTQDYIALWREVQRRIRAGTPAASKPVT